LPPTTRKLAAGPCKGASDLLSTPLTTLQGEPTTLRDLTGGGAALVVNVASRCGLTPQYTLLEALQQEYGGRGLTVVGVPCNQFAGQEPGTAEEIAGFCSATYGVTFPMTEKVDVNGPGRHPVYDALVPAADAEGRDGDVTWNFEKFLLDGSGAVVARFAPTVVPDDPQVVAAIESLVSDVTDR
jgi:glutathione peroxidase